VALKSKHDVVAEVLLTYKYSIKAYSKWGKEEDCKICFETMKNQYVLQYPCDPTHVVHRNCALMNILHHRYTCPICRAYPMPVRSI
jgi:hypothetical protein